MPSLPVPAETTLERPSLLPGKPVTALPAHLLLPTDDAIHSVLLSIVYHLPHDTWAGVCPFC